MSERLHPDDLREIMAALRQQGQPMNGAAKWVLAVAAVLLTGALGFLGSKVNDLDKAMAVTNQKLAALEKAMDGKMGDRFTGNDARAMAELFGLRIATVERDVEQLENRVGALEVK